MKRLYCPECGDENIIRNATARWDPRQVKWTVHRVQDTYWCLFCGVEFHDPIVKTDVTE